MSLLLTIQKAPDSVVIEESTKTFDSMGGTIGRGKENTWLLKDPERFLSNVHCEISFENGQFYLIDRSTNGTFFNGSPDPIGKGEKVPIKTNDTFIIGDYQFSASESAQGLDVDISDPFASAAPSSSSSSIDDIFSDPLADNGLGGDAGFGQSGFSIGNDADAGSLTDFGSAETDPLAALDKAQGASANPSLNAFDSREDPFAAGTLSDQVDPLNQQISWPDSAPEQNFGQGMAIPDDWDDDLLSPSANIQPAPPSSTPIRPSAVPPPVSSQQPPAADFQPSRSAATANLSTGSVDRSFIHGLGLDDKNLDEAAVAAINQMAGELFREMVKGLMLILASRNSIKNEFRMNMTTIQPKENNPLKFSATVDDALENMFLKHSDAYKKPFEAIQDGFDSIAEHQLAILAGIREAFRGVVGRFDPEFLEERFSKHHKGALLPVSQKAKNWESYIDYYDELVGDIDKSFKYLYGDGFVKAYEDQLKKLSISRKANKFKD